MIALSLLMSLAFNTPAAIETAFDRLAAGELEAAAVLLDEAAASDPTSFQWNNLHYLRGRLAEAAEDWNRADAAFAEVSERSVLHPLAVWHRARTAFKTGRVEEGLGLYERLPSGFPQSLRLELARLSPEPARSTMHRGLSGREVDWERASLANDTPAMWRLIERSGADDIALEIAYRLDSARGLTPSERLRLAQTFYTQRIFDRAARLYSTLLEDSRLGAQAHFELGRTYFQLTRYDEAIAMFRATILRHPDTQWERDAELQVATAYWRKLDFETAAAAYRVFLDKYGADRRLYHGAVRDLIDIYRALGRNEDAMAWIDRALDSQPSASDRAVLLFTKAKIDFGQGRYVDAAAGFRQLTGMRLRPAPNGADAAEARYLEALSLERLGRIEDARRIWRELAGAPMTYYGLKSLARLNDEAMPAAPLEATVRRTFEEASVEFCQNPANAPARIAARNRRLERTRGYLTAPGETDLVGELVFLHLWDEAYFWASNAQARWSDQALADLAYLSSRFRQAMLYADRLRPSDERRLFRFDGGYDADEAALLEMLYPRAYGDIVCREAAEAGVNPLWLHAIIWQESRYDPQARSGASARGLMQFIPETAAEVAAEADMDASSPTLLYDPAYAIKLGARYWARLMSEFDHPELALAAYNGGPHNVRRWRAKYAEDDAELFLAEIGFVETKEYVQRVFSHYFKYAHLASAP